MPGKSIIRARGKDNLGDPPERGTPEWDLAVKEIRIVKDKKEGKDRPFCGEAGGRRTDGWPCESPYVKESGRCKMHGGNHVRGVKHHLFKHGRRSQVFEALPEKFRAGYTASLEDDDLLSLRTDIALNDVRMKDLLERLDTGENEARWKGVENLVRRLRVQLADTELDRDSIKSIAKELGDLVDDAEADERNWRDLREASQHRRKLVDSERQRLKDLHAYLSAEEALAIVARLTDAVIRHVENKDNLAAILQEVQVITGTDPRQRIEA